MEIPRALLEQYFRATGWTFVENDGGWVCGAKFVSNDDDLDYQTIVLARRSGVSVLSLAFRLGLCAAAERCLLHAHELGLANVVVGHGVLLSQAAELLSAAGIELATWERARHKGAGDGDS